MNNDIKKWAESTFGQCDLGDPRRTKRLIKYAQQQAEAPTFSTIASSNGNTAKSEGAYRLLRNKHVEADDIMHGVAQATAELCQGRQVLLAIQDTTSVDVAHIPLRKELSDSGSPTGFLVHSTLMVDAKAGLPVGLIDLVHWTRPKNREKKRANKKAYIEKESYRWEQASCRMVELIGDVSHIITVCDREADIYEFLQYHKKSGQRFIVRAAQNRRINDDELLWDKMESLPVVGYREIQIEQRGPWKPVFEKVRPGRKKRTATLEVRAGEVTLLCPKNDSPKDTAPIVLNAVYVREINVPEGREALEWRLLTTESVKSQDEANTVVNYYEKRWIIEEFHCSWKVGCRLEERPFQSLKAVARMIAITAPIGVRLLQLQCLADGNPNGTCEKILTKEEWQCLHTFSSQDKALPSKAPTNEWVYYAIAKMGGWIDTKRTGRVGWKAMWIGWSRFQDQLHGWRMAKGAYGGH